MNNPFLENKWSTPYESIPFDQITLEHYKEAFPKLIEAEDAAFEQMCAQQEAPTFENFFEFEPLHLAEEKLGILQSVFFNMNSAETNDEMQAFAQEISPILSEKRLQKLFNKTAFQRLQVIYNQMDESNLNAVQKRLVTKVYNSYVDNGALLDDVTQERIKTISMRLSELSMLFMKNNLSAQNHYAYWVEDETRLKGLPKHAIEQAKEEAVKADQPDSWKFTLKMPSKLPVYTYAEDRSLRQGLYDLDAQVCVNDEFSTLEYIKEIVSLKAESAKLLGKETIAAFTLKNRMAQNQETVVSFLNDFLTKALPFGKEDFQTLKKYAASLGQDDFQPWDVNFYREKLKMEKFSISDELLKPYFSLERCIQGMFDCATKLFGITFKKNESIPVYHEEVSCYEVYDADGSFLALFYADFFPRDGKRAGAWMTSFKGQYIDSNNVNHRPHVSIVCNFTKPTTDAPSLLTFNELTTLYHEFGHALHGLLANGKYEYFSGTSVAWDFVELPSQLMENWCYEPECLKLFAYHYETQELIPQEYIDKIVASSQFMAGYDTCRQLSLGLLDMAWHTQSQPFTGDVLTFEKQAVAPAKTTDFEQKSFISPVFGHIFAGGYAAGYYSYKWAEVLEADVFESFQEEGIFNPETGKRLRDCILSKGSEEDENIIYERFKGRKPTPDALMKKAGLI